ncbi:hypothetical protein MPSEU_000098000 [Mayamaea pseudoterrestris]|nr:hypothetical protein MPSEU_000097300 [Mayamaea pseudoterrestris]GKY91254.1 hypothetical protein MPSEU_000098000 [Mayamaea pseudoterrestris]
MNFPWKQQKIVRRGPTADYSHLREPLPKPPTGKIWKEQKDTREWRLVNCSVDEQKVLAMRVVENIPSDIHDNNEEWEVLSEKQLSQNSAPSLIAKVGSVRSLASMEQHLTSDCTPCSLPCKIQRTTSSSTIDSCDNALGPSGKGVLGVDYVEHVVLPTDTLQGICLAYKVNVTRLRQANSFSGNSLLLAPKKLVIPLSKQALRSGCIRVQDTDAKEYKLHAFLAEYPDLGTSEARAYLELADWVLEDASQSAREDCEWEKDLDTNSLKAGEIRITSSKGYLNAKGAGIRNGPIFVPEDDVPDDLESHKVALPQITPPDSIPAIASKTTKAHDIYLAQQGQGEFGVEMKLLTKPLLPNDGLVAL